MQTSVEPIHPFATVLEEIFGWFDRQEPIESQKCSQFVLALAKVFAEFSVTSEVKLDDCRSSKTFDGLTG